MFAIEDQQVPIDQLRGHRNALLARLDELLARKVSNNAFITMHASVCMHHLSMKSENDSPAYNDGDTSSGPVCEHATPEGGSMKKAVIQYVSPCRTNCSSSSCANGNNSKSLMWHGPKLSRLEALWCKVRIQSWWTAG